MQTSFPTAIPLDGFWLRQDGRGKLPLRSKLFVLIMAMVLGFNKSQPLKPVLNTPICIASCQWGKPQWQTLSPTSKQEDYDKLLKVLTSSNKLLRKWKAGGGTFIP